MAACEKCIYDICKTAGAGEKEHQERITNAARFADQLIVTNAARFADQLIVTNAARFADQLIVTNAAVFRKPAYGNNKKADTFKVSAFYYVRFIPQK